ncbi:hypothetical protein Mapa_011206 [Marchantia paleacea]|nr:hypothetical protein Mapa_011206 [Marchantia paleacea]
MYHAIQGKLNGVADHSDNSQPLRPIMESSVEDFLKNKWLEVTLPTTDLVYPEHNATTQGY